MAINFNQLQSAGAHAQSLNFSKAQEIQAGQRINFSKENPGVNKVRVELYWDSDHDGDASVLLLDSNKKALQGTVAGATNPNATRGMVWYKNLSVPGVTHSGDVQEGSSDSSEPEETIVVQLNELDREADSVLVVASTYPAKNARTGKYDGPAVPFGQLRDCKVMVVDDATNYVLYVYELSEDFSVHTSVELASFYKRDNEWRYTSMGEGVGKSREALSDIASKYGLY